MPSSYPKNATKGTKVPFKSLLSFNEGFNQIKERFNQIKERFNQIKERFN
jgi:hypothetical protein